MQLTVDLEISHTFAHQKNLEKLVGKADVSLKPIPLEALLSQYFSLQLAPDYPLAAVAASADGINVAEGYWMRADPVHLVLQRDSFSLGEPVPLIVSGQDTHQMIATLNAHFAQDGMSFFAGKSGAWYMQWPETPDIRTNLPSSVIGKDIHSFMPKGAYAGKWLSHLNEIQMLLFEHPVNLAREASGLGVVNSIWISGGGSLPAQPEASRQVLLTGDTPLYRGLAKWAGLHYQMLGNVEALLAMPEQDVRLYLQADSGLETWLDGFYQALKARKIKQLTFNIGFYDRCLVATLQPWDLYRFWQNNKSLENLLA